MTALECFDNSSREHRELIQKKMYLCQCFGMTIPFDFGWGRQYAPKFCDKYEITPKEQKVIDYINDLDLQIEKKSLMMDECFFYRLLADMAYAETTELLCDKSEIARFLRKSYPIYKDDFNGTYAVFSFMKKKSFA